MLTATTLVIFVLTNFCSGDLPCNKVSMKYGYVCVCNSTYCDTIGTPKKISPKQFHFYYTSEESPGFNHETGHFRIQSASHLAMKYVVNKTKLYQKLRGFGGSFTDSFGVNLNTLSDDAQLNLLKSYFSEDGLEYSVGRIVLGSSDFSLRNYTYLPKYDPTLNSFNLTEDDYLYKIPHIKRAISLSKRRIHFLGSTWNGPDWLKIRNATRRGYLKNEAKQIWADYHVRTLDTFRSEGIEFWALTTGNEPITLFSFDAIPIVVMFPEQQREWIVYNLGPALEKANYSTNIFVLDDMRYFAIWWMDSIMRDKRSNKYVSGIGLHYYTDLYTPPETLDKFHEKYPNQEIIYTESSVNFIITFFEPNVTNSTNNHENPYFRNKPFLTENIGEPHLGSWFRGSFYAINIIENLKHWVTTYIDWNLALDEKGGPTPNYPCDAGIIVNETNNEFYKQPLFYVMGHFSKFIQPGAYIVDLSENVSNVSDIWNQSINSNDFNMQSFMNTTQFFSNDVQYVGALNPDGSISLIFYNPKPSSVVIEVYDEENGYAFVILEPNSLNTLLYWY